MEIVIHLTFCNHFFRSCVDQINHSIDTTSHQNVGFIRMEFDTVYTTLHFYMLLLTFIDIDDINTAFMDISTAAS